jgi:enoyl-CoA hydratase/carnithine racemase
MTEPAVIEERNGAVLRLTINRPAQLNAVIAEVLARLEAPLRLARGTGPSAQS